MTAAVPARTPTAAAGDRFARVAGALAVASLPLAAGNLVAMLAAVHFDLAGMNDPLALLRAGPGAAPLWRWAMVLDILGYYLLIVPLVLQLRVSSRPRSPQGTDLFALCLVAYCLIGAAGGAALATAIPTLIQQFAAADSDTHRQALQIAFTGYTDGVYRGEWNLLEEFVAGVGWIGFGALTYARRRQLGVLTVVLGGACLTDSLGTALHLDAVSSPGLIVYLVLAPLWACWSGLDMLRTPRRPAPDGTAGAPKAGQASNPGPPGTSTARL